MPNETTYKQRWGDAPVHTIAAALLAGTDRIHFFREIGYEHDGYTHCPLDDLWRRGRCACDPAQNFGMRSDSSMGEPLTPFVRFCGIVVSSEVGTDKRPPMMVMVSMMASVSSATHLENPASRSSCRCHRPSRLLALVYWLGVNHLYHCIVANTSSSLPLLTIVLRIFNLSALARHLPGHRARRSKVIRHCTQSREAPR